jgi:hypothetical protein
MERHHARALSNSFRSVRLFNLSDWPEAAPFAEEPGRGPFVILQTAYDPEDPTASVQDFILSRDGRWLPLEVFYQLDDNADRGEFVHPTAAAAITVLQGLKGRPNIIRAWTPKAPASDAGASSAARDSLRETLERSRGLELDEGGIRAGQV